MRKLYRQRFNPFDDLITPKTVYACLNIKANKDEILRALKELVIDLESDPDAS